MKAVIVDIDGENAIALNKDGAFLKLKNNGQYRTGYEVEIPSNPLLNFNTLYRLMPIAAVFLIFVGIGWGGYTYFSPYSYVDVDINPSIEITSNIFDRIIKVEGLNEDGKNLLSNNSYSNENINDGINNILKVAVNHGYIVSSTTSAVMLTVSGKDDVKVGKMEAEIQKTVDTEFKSSGTKADVIVENVTLKGRDEALGQGISPGKLLLIQRLIKVDPSAKIEDYKNASVKEIMNQINAFNDKLKENSTQKTKENQNKTQTNSTNNEAAKTQNKAKTDMQENGKNSSDSAVRGNKLNKESKTPAENTKKEKDATKQDKQKRNIADNNKKKANNKSDIKDSKKTRNSSFDTFDDGAQEGGGD